MFLILQLFCNHQQKWESSNKKLKKQAHFKESILRCRVKSEVHNRPHKTENNENDHCKQFWVKWVKSLSCVRLFATPWTVAPQAPPSMGFSRQEDWSGLPFPSPGDLPDPGIELRSPALQADALPSELKSLEAILGDFFCHGPFFFYWIHTPNFLLI